MFKDVLRLMEMLHKFGRVERVVRLPGQEGWENDVEHSYVLSMLAVYVRDFWRPALDRDKVQFYALIHDIVEVYAGDTFFYEVTTEEQMQEKHEREKGAAKRLLCEFGDWAVFCEALHAYETRADEEARFVYAMDKVAPILTIMIDGGRTWKEMDIQLERLLEMKRPKITDDPTALALFEEIAVHLREHEEELFGS